MKSNQLKLGVLLSYASMALNMVVQLVYTPVMIRLLGQSEYGLYTLVGSVVSYLSLFSLGFTGAYLRFYSRYAQKGDRTGVARLNGMFLTLFLCMSAAAIVCGMTLSQFTPQLFGSNLTPAELSKAKVLMQILVVNVALTFPSSVFDSIVSAHEQFLFQRVLQLAGVAFNPLICLPLLLMGHGSVAVVGVTTAITIAKLATNIWFCRFKIHAPFEFRHFNFSLLKEIGAFSFFLFLNMIIDQVNWSVDKFILGRVAGTIQVAIYGVATQFNSMYQTFATAISSVFAPRVNRIVAEQTPDSDKEVSDLLVRVGRLQYIISLYIFIGFLFAGRQFVMWWAGNEYEASYLVAIWLLSPMVIILPHSLGIEIRRAKNRHQLASVIMFGTAVFNVAISIPLAHIWGAAGAAFGTWLGLLVNTVIIDVYYVKLIHLDIKRLYLNIIQLSKSVAIPIGFGLIGICFDSLEICLAWAIPYSALYGFFVYRFGMNNSERELAKKPLAKLMKR